MILESMLALFAQTQFSLPEDSSKARDTVTPESSLLRKDRINPAILRQHHIPVE